MIVRLIKKTKIHNFFLPETVSGNYWITDTDSYGNIRNLINVEEDNGRWKIKSDFETKIMSGNEVLESAILSEYGTYFLKIGTENEFVILYCSPTIEKEITMLRASDNQEVLIGMENRSHIYYNFPLISKQQTRLYYANGVWTVQDLNSKYGTFVNNESITSKQLENGDVIFIVGLKVIIMKDMLIINNIPGLLRLDTSSLEKITPPIQTQTEFDTEDDENIEFFKEEDYFYKSPRFKTSIEEQVITVESPPSVEENEEKDMPILYTLGPMITMGMMSMSMGVTTLMGLVNGTADLSTSWPSLLTTGAMLSTMLLWPLLQRSYQKKLQKKANEKRITKYSEYLNNKTETIQREIAIQRQILIDNYLPLSQVKDIIYGKKRNLWEREIDQPDFLELRLGIGSTKFKGSINIPEPKFSIEENKLLEEVYKLGAMSKNIDNVPITLNFVDNNIVTIIGTSNNKMNFINGLILQILAYHSYEDLKIVVFTNEQNAKLWEYIKFAPHNWRNDKGFRYFSTNLDEAKEISLELEKEFQNRKYKDGDTTQDINTQDYHRYKPYYFIITDDYKTIRDIEIIKDITSMSINYGFSLTVSSPRLTNVPNECKDFISFGDQKSGIFEDELVSNKQKEFDADFDPSINMYQCCQILSNIPIDTGKENRSLPNSISFLEMYNVGMVEQLNILNRWKTNDPTKSLQTPVGVDKSGELFKLDLHEKAHGPHGLIAGMTGSGKSEFIITYILSMALNYHPEEVSFVLIDYKGGGLTGAFENKEQGIKLPHLAGTITNLDTVEMNRALASIQSELRKRQRLFNIARDKLNESTIDIYKYQSLYRQGLVNKPISHLLIISDEFAELKDQRPEFMEQLISTARIGRSLGVHLILATQKPSGVVNDQIWSNSKFRVCLKVQDKSDSMDMIKCPDAAEIKNTGRFYLQVGYNELFALGQAAWAGAQYYPTEKRKKKVDQTISIVDNVGNIIKSLETQQNNKMVTSKGEEIKNIINYIISEGKKENISIDKLWLDKIPDVIYTQMLKEKYNFIPKRNVIEPIIGEYDDPDNQRQGLLTLNLSKDGNTIVFGSAGSGKELLLSGLIHSCVTMHSPKEVNFYILDFGAETLTMFKNIPHVGEVILSTNAEKISNLFKLITSIIEERKKIFVDYNGSYDFYIHHGGKQIPMIVIIINNIEGFLETYDEYEELLTQISRDCLKYGVIFVLSTSATNTVRYKIRQNFKQNIVLQFNDSLDYGSILAGARRKEPSKIYGRGLVEHDAVYEFQTAYPYKDDKITDYIKILGEKLSQVCTFKAQKIPILPEIVDKDFVKEYLGSISTLPVGVSKSTLEIETINLTPKKCYLITCEDMQETENNVYSLLTTLEEDSSYKTIIIDTEEFLTGKEFKEHTKYYTDNYNDAIELIKEETNQNSNIIIPIIGISSLFNKDGGDIKKEITTLINEGKNKLNSKYIIIDSIDNIKSFCYEPWFTTSVDLTEGIWLGNGLGNQFTLKVTTNSRLLREEIAPGFGYVINKGKANLIKVVSDE